MAAIPGIAYLIIGGGVVLISKYFGNEDLNLGFFFWIGIAFIAVGVFKIVIRFITKMPNSEKGKDYAKATLKPLEGHQEQEGEISMYPKYCPKCKLLYTNQSNFCSRCGNQLYNKQ